AEAKVRAAQARQAGNALQEAAREAEAHTADAQAQLRYARALLGQDSYIAALLPAERAARLAPASAEAQLLVAQICTTLEYRRPAEEHYRRALELDPAQLEAYQGLGNLRLAAGDVAGARRVFQQARDRAPGLPGPALSVARLELDQSRPAEALAALEPVLKEQSPPVAALYLAGKACQTLGQTTRGIELLRRALQAEPNFADAYHVLGSILCNQANYAEGIPALRKAAELSPTEATYSYALGNALRTDHSRPDRLHEAKRAYETALEVDPRFAWAHYYYGLTLEELGEREAAVREYQRTLELHPKFGSAYYRLGGLLQIMGRKAEAQRYLGIFEKESQQAIAEVHGKRKERAIPDTAEEHYQRGKKYLAQGDRERALADFRVALQRDPSHGLARRALRELGQ
ncbi:MAG TPA: tetratricopeptide repeat protein, partial [Armatimonadota bacterium]|nr:tetratricopeptide repeat protein [Armatimonadota bacterium]